ncbi:rRNA-processing protein bfr2 [Microbotryomycetes sp. JL221]|nr:rRNA-processing protein bfr2 [Microbotryomycetes sp. JL221]
MSKRLTLAEQLDQISQPTPQDFDPEDSYATYNNEQQPSTTTQDSNQARQDYIQVGPSGLRRKNQNFVDPKYKGQTKSRRELFQQDDSQQEEDDDAHDDDDDAHDDDDSDDDEQDSQDLDAALDQSHSDNLDDDDQDDDDDNDDDDNEPHPLKPTMAPPPTKQQADKHMLSQLRQAASADVLKGRHVKRQLTFCDNILESRIKLQKSTTAINTLPRLKTAQKFFNLIQSDVEQTWQQINQLNEQLFELRTRLAQTNEQISLPNDFGTTRKRKRSSNDSHSDYLDATLLDLATFDSTCEPYLKSTVTKWSDKVLAASGLNLNSTKKFKSINQNVMSQIEHSLKQTEQDRLLKRTRINRNFEKRKPIGINESSYNNEVDANVFKALQDESIENKQTTTNQDVEIFDDGDFYQQLLRDVVESRMLDLDDSTLENLRMASARHRKQKKIVDTRASKGRKIRYHVHEKAQNFMIPIQAGVWHDEQIDELFSSLLGRNLSNHINNNNNHLNKQLNEVNNEDNEMNQIQTQQVDVGSLRLFG